MQNTRKNRNPNDPAIRERDRPNPFEELTTAKEERVEVVSEEVVNHQDINKINNN
jgi:hypothetical protein